MTSFNGAFSDQIDWALQEFLESNFNSFEAKQGNSRFGVKSNQKVDIAIEIKVISEDGTKNSQFSGLTAK